MNIEENGVFYKQIGRQSKGWLHQDVFVAGQLLPFQVSLR